MFCPRCGFARTGPLCANCGYDFVKGAETPAVTLSRGINPVSLAIGLVAVATIAAVIWLALST